jgi:hypothetical protein
MYSLGCCYRNTSRNQHGYPASFTRSIKAYQVISDGVTVQSKGLVNFVTFITIGVEDIPDENHFLFQLALFIQLRADPIAEIINIVFGYFINSRACTYSQ